MRGLESIAASTAENVAESVGYEITQTDVNALLGFASTVEVTLYIILAVLILVFGMLFALIATKGWHE